MRVAPGVSINQPTGQYIVLLKDMLIPFQRRPFAQSFSVTGTPKAHKIKISAILNCVDCNICLVT